MRILYMHQHFTTRLGFTGNRSYEFAKYLVRQGHEVSMICSGVENEPRLTLRPRQESMRITIDGIQCIPIRAAVANPLTITGHSGYRRMLGFLNFVRVAKRVGRTLSRPDVVFASHTPLTIGLAGIDLARYFGVPMVFEVRDLWPQALVNLGVLRNPLVILWMKRMERKIYRASQHIVALSPGMKAGIVATQVVNDSEVTVIPNASDLDLFDPTLDRRFGRERLGLQDQIAAIYFGGMGMANGLEYAIQAAKLLQDKGNDQIVIVLHGGGGRKAAHQQQVQELGLHNVRFSDPVPDKTVVARLVAACDICLTIYRATRERTWSPNKMFDAMAAGRPIIINVPGWLGDTVEANECGFSVDPDDPAALVAALERLAANPELRKRLGANSRAVAEREFSREILAGRLEKVLLKAIEEFTPNRSRA